MDTDFKKIVDNKIQRDSSIKELQDGHYKTAQMMKKLVRDFQSMNTEECQELKQLDNLASNHINVTINTNIVSSYHLPCLHLKLKLGTKVLPLAAIPDTGSSHVTAPHWVMDKLNITREMLRNQNRYKLNTVLNKDEKNSILGMYPLTLVLKDREGLEHNINVEVIFMQSPLRCMLLSWALLKSFDFRFDTVREQEFLTLKLKHEKINKRYFFPTMTRFPGDQSACLLTNMNNIFSNKGKTHKIVCRGELSPGTYILHSGKDEPTLAVLSEQSRDNDIVFPITMRMGEDRTYTPGEKVITATQVFSDTEAGVVMSHLTQAEDSPEDKKADLKPILKRSTTTSEYQTPVRGQEYRDISALTQQIVPEMRENKFSEEELAKLEDLTLPDTFLESAAFRRSGLYPNHESPEEDLEDPDFGTATAEEILELKNIFNSYPQVWAKHKYDVGLFTGFEVDLPTLPGEKVAQKEREHTLDQEEAAGEVIEALMEAGIIDLADPTNPEQWSSNWLCQEKTAQKQTSKADKMQKKREKKMDMGPPSSSPP